MKRSKLSKRTTEYSGPRTLTQKVGLSLAFVGLAAMVWLVPVRAQDGHGAAPDPHAATTQQAAPDTHSQDPHAPAASTAPEPDAQGAPHGEVPNPAEAAEHGAAPAAEHGDTHAEGQGDAHAGEHGDAHGSEGEHQEEQSFDIHLKTWLYGPLQQFWFSGQAQISAAGAVYADNPGQAVSADQLVGQEFPYTYDYHGRKFNTTAKIVSVGNAVEAANAATETVEINGRQVLLIQPEAKFPRASAFPEGLALSIVTAILLGGLLVFLARDLRRVPTKKQTVLEMIYEALDNFVHGLIGPDYKRYVPLVGTGFIYIFMMNWGILVPGWGAPTANINVTAGMAVVVIAYVHYHGIRANGVKGYLMHYVGDPWWLGPLNFPIHLIGEVAKVMSLTIRLFGNIFGEDVVVVILISLGVIMMKGVPLQFPMYPLVLFTSFVQAMVFSILTCVYIALMTTHDHEEHHGEEHAHAHAH